MVSIRKVGSNSYGFIKRGVNTRRFSKRDSQYADNYRKAFNIQKTHQEKLVQERKEQQKKKFAERKRIIANIIGLNKKRRKIHRKKRPIRYRERIVTRYRYI